MLAAMKKKRNWNRFSLASKKMWDKEGGDARMPQVFLLDQFADGLNYAKYACDTHSILNGYIVRVRKKKMAFILNIKKWNMSRDED